MSHHAPHIGLAVDSFPYVQATTIREKKALITRVLNFSMMYSRLRLLLTLNSTKESKINVKVIRREIFKCEVNVKNVNVM